MLFINQLENTCFLSDEVRNLLHFLEVSVLNVVGTVAL